MAIKIYFDDELIKGDGLMSLSQSGELFDSTFKLGATLCREVNLQLSISHLPKNESPGVVKIYDDNDIKFTLHVDNKEKVDDMSYSYTLVDSMVKLNTPLSNIFNWDTSASYTVQTIVDKICDYIGSKHIVIEYIGNLSMNWGWDTSARDFLSYVGEINASFVRINPSGDIEFVEHKKATVRHLDVATCEDIAVGEYHKIERVGYEQGTASIYQPINQGEFNTVYINPDNVLITDSSEFTREDIINHIYSKINGFEFYSIKINRCQVDQNAIAGDNLIVKIIEQCKLTTPDGKFITDELGRKIIVALEKGLPTIIQTNWDFNARWNGGYELEIDSLQQEETQIVDNTVKQVRKLKITVDRELGKITQKVTEVDTKIDATNKDLTDYKQTVSETYSTIEQTSTSITESVEAMKTTIEGDVEQKYATKASLELYVTEDEAETNVVSWINASADNIILNTKKLIFGEYPNGQYITVENSYINKQKIGVLFSGTGKISMYPVGEIRLQNRNSENDNFLNEILATSYGYGNNEIKLTNKYDVDLIANSLSLLTTSQKYELIIYNNDWNHNSNKSNNIAMKSDATSNVIYLENCDNTKRANMIKFDTNFNGYHSLYFQNYDNNGGVLNFISLVGLTNNNSLNLVNKNDSTHVANKINLQTVDGNGKRAIWLQNFDASGNVKNYISLQNNSDDVRIQIANEFGARKNYIIMSEKDGVFIKNSYSCQLWMDMSQNITLSGPNGVNINSTNYQVHINAPQGVFVNGNKIG